MHRQIAHSARTKQSGPSGMWQPIVRPHFQAHLSRERVVPCIPREQRVRTSMLQLIDLTRASPRSFLERESAAPPLREDPNREISRYTREPYLLLTMPATSYLGP